RVSRLLLIPSLLSRSFGEATAEPSLGPAGAERKSQVGAQRQQNWAPTLHIRQLCRPNLKSGRPRLLGGRPDAPRKLGALSHKFWEAPPRGGQEFFREVLSHRGKGCQG
ncbi:Hypothetical predicted protein, partial [Marmota monax]